MTIIMPMWVLLLLWLIVVGIVGLAVWVAVDTLVGWGVAWIKRRYRRCLSARPIPPRDRSKPAR